MTALRDAEFWRAGRHSYPAGRLTEAEIVTRLVAHGFRVELLETIRAETTDPAEPSYHG